MERKIKGLNWSDEETCRFIQLCLDKKVLSLIDGKKFKQGDIFKSLEESMGSKDANQMKVKLKHLKEQFYKEKRRINESGAAGKSFKFFDLMAELLNERPSLIAVDDAEGIDSTLSIEILDDENIEPCCSQKMQPTPAKSKPGGRTSYANSLQKFADSMAEKQKEILKEIILEENWLLKNTLEENRLEQQKWEEKMLEKEQNFQKEQTKALLDGFLQAIQLTNSERLQNQRFFDENESIE